jgi:hypothetical protein
VEKNCNINLKYPNIKPSLTDWAFKFKYDFTRQLEDFLSSGLIIDYIGIKVVYQGELALIATKPAVELNIINNGLFVYDLSYCYNTIQNKAPALWVDQFDPGKFKELKAKKMDSFGLTAGISLFGGSEEQLISISFATNKNYNNINDYYLANTEYLYKISAFVEKISWPMFCKIFATKLPKNHFQKNSDLFMAVDNTVNF